MVGGLEHLDNGNHHGWSLSGTFETQDRIITALAPKPDEEIIAAFSKRKKCP